MKVEPAEVEQVDMQPIVQDHEKRITKLEIDQNEFKAEINKQISSVKEQVLTGMIRSSDENKVLREDNRKMMEMLVGINSKTEERKHEIRILNKQNFWKLVFGISGSMTVLITVVQSLLKYFTGQ